MPKFRVDYQSWVYNFVHHLARYEIDAKDLPEAEAWAKSQLAKFSDRDNAVLKSIEEVKNA